MTRACLGGTTPLGWRQIARWGRRCCGKRHSKPHGGPTPKSACEAGQGGHIGWVYRPSCGARVAAVVVFWLPFQLYNLRYVSFRRLAQLSYSFIGRIDGLFIVRLSPTAIQRLFFKLRVAQRKDIPDPVLEIPQFEMSTNDCIVGLPGIDLSRPYLIPVTRPGASRKLQLRQRDDSTGNELLMRSWNVQYLSVQPAKGPMPLTTESANKYWHWAGGDSFGFGGACGFYLGGAFY